jgi:hypothetical protein
MHERIEHGLVVDLNGEKVNLEALRPAGIDRGCSTKATVLACRNTLRNSQHIQHIGILCGQTFAEASPEIALRIVSGSPLGRTSRRLMCRGIDSPFLHRPGMGRPLKLDSTLKLLNTPFRNRRDEPMPPLRPGQWLLHTPIAILPFLAALFIQRPVAGRAGGGFSLGDFALLLQHHWFWLVVTLGLGVWVGWQTAIDRPLYQEADVEADAP